MNKKFILALMFSCLFLLNTPASFAKKQKIVKPVQCSVSETNFAQKEITDFLSNYEKFTNEQDIDKLKNLYSEQYINADNIDKKAYFELIDRTWKNFQNTKFSYVIKEIKVNDYYASVLTTDSIVATTNNKSAGDTGELSSTSSNILYLQKFGKEWKIVSDRILAEKTFLKYGRAKQVKVDFTAPEQVYAGTNYTATINTEAPPQTLVIGSISREPIVYPEINSEEVFRQIPTDYGILERVMKSNTTNNNELAIGSVGYTELINDIFQKPEVKLTGIALMMQRVNVIPKSQFVPVVKKKVKDEQK